MKQAEEYGVFEIRIDGCRDNTWQGKLTTEGYTEEFRSELELLLAINKLLKGGRDEFSLWENRRQKMKADKREGTSA